MNVSILIQKEGLTRNKDVLEQNLDRKARVICSISKALEIGLHKPVGQIESTTHS